MNISKILNGTELTVALEGRLDTTTAPELEAELKGGLDGVEALVIDPRELAYISFAGLRVILSAQKRMNSPVCQLFGKRGISHSVFIR